MKKLLIIVLFLISFILSAFDKQYLKFCPQPSQITEHEYYVIYFSKENMIPIFTLYLLTKEMSDNNTFSREGFTFPVDPKLQSIHEIIYKGQRDIDKGHLVPAEDMRFSLQALKECFYTSNICPQYSRYNRGIWKALELYVRLLSQNENLIIISGTVSIKKNLMANKIVIPDAFYKVIYKLHSKEIECYYIPHRNDYSTEKISNFKITLNELEQKTGLKFFKMENINILIKNNK